MAYDHHFGRNGNLSEWEEESFDCDCGALIDFSYEIDVRGQAEVSTFIDDKNEQVKPAPNQLDMFTGMTIQEAQNKPILNLNNTIQ